MRARSLLVVLALFTLGDKKRDGAAGAPAAPLDRRARCQLLAEQTTQMGVLLARGLVSGLSEGKEKLPDDEEAKLKAELKQAEHELVEQCMGWSEETLDCFGTGAIFNTEKCERLIAEAMGEAVPPADVPAGPAPAWTFTLPHEQSLLHGCDDGTVLVVIEPDSDHEPAEDAPVATLVAIADGKQRWAQALPVSPWSIEPIDATTVMLVLPRELVGTAIADGSERWRAPLPDDDASPRAILREGEAYTILDSGRRVLQVVPAKCPKGACVEVVATMAADDPEGGPGLDLYDAADLVRLPDGGLAVLVSDEQRMVVLDAKAKLRFAVESRVALSWAHVDEGALVIAMDGELVAIDPSKCGSEGRTFAPSTWPPPGKPDWLRDATVREREWANAPAECVRWRQPLAHAEVADPPVAGIDPLVVQAGGFLVATGEDGERWKSVVAAQSLAVKHGDAVAVLGDIGSSDTELALMWLDPTSGKHVARTPIAVGKGELFLLEGPQLVGAGPLVVAGYERDLAAFGR